MYSVILIDDEHWALIGMRKSFDWERMGFSVVGETTDSGRALELIYSLKPDAVFSDIRMGELSGLDLIKEARKRQIPSEFVFISGYAEFAYAQEALRWGAFDYLLKPIHLDEANGILANLKARLDQKQALEQPGLKEKEPDAFGAMLQYISVNYCKPLQLQELSAMYFMNFSYCSELFRKRTGKTFTAYILDMRMKKALELMRIPSLTMLDIAEKIGYPNYPHFSRLFRRLYGCSPSDYRQSLVWQPEYSEIDGRS